MLTRKRVPELMDDPSLDYGSHVSALLGLERLNAASGGPSSIWAEIEPVARLLNRPVRILDIATGGGDIPIAIYRMAQKAGVAVEIVASDISSDALKYAAESAAKKGAKIEFFPLDIFKDELPSNFDVIMTSLFTHHLDADDVIMLLRKMSGAARFKVIVNDLVRSEMSYVSVWLATRLLSRSPIVHYDGPVSVNASYTPSEFLNMAERAGLNVSQEKNLESSVVAVKLIFPCRQLLTWQRSPKELEIEANFNGSGQVNGATGKIHHE
ncbi:class I SAM-dependent methyltransferase [soil metagenome]